MNSLILCKTHKNVFDFFYKIEQRSQDQQTFHYKIPTLVVGTYCSYKGKRQTVYFCSDSQLPRY